MREHRNGSADLLGAIALLIGIIVNLAGALTFEPLIGALGMLLVVVGIAAWFFSASKPDRRDQ